MLAFVYLLLAVVFDTYGIIKKGSWSFFFKKFLPKFVALLDTLKLSTFFFLKKSNKEKIEALAIRTDEEKIIYEPLALNREESIILGHIIIIYSHVIKKINLIDSGIQNVLIASCTGTRPGKITR